MNHRILDFRFLKLIAVLILLSLGVNNTKAEDVDTDAVLQQIEILQNDIKTLEKAVYSDKVNTNNTNVKLSVEEGDVLTKHLLKLSELEEQFKNLTNSFEEINFKLDKLSTRITKIQTDNQMRFQDIEKSEVVLKKNKSNKKKLPGSSEPQDLGSVSVEVVASDEVQKTQSIESVGSVVSEEAERVEKILPEGTPEEQYDFAISFLKVGDYETAEYALYEFIKINSKHDLAGNAQYWYGETFRVRQLYQDAATAYLDGYQKYPDSSKAPVNLLKLGVMLVKIGEKTQGCSMIIGVKEQYPKAAQSVIQKAEYEKKKFSCQQKG
jgi:tol-pal system protein YbgF